MYLCYFLLRTYETILKFKQHKCLFKDNGTKVLLVPPGTRTPGGKFCRSHVWKELRKELTLEIYCGKIKIAGKRLQVLLREVLMRIVKRYSKICKWFITYYKIEF